MLVRNDDGVLVEGANLGIEEEHTCADVLLGVATDLRPYIRKTHWPTLDIIPSSPDLVEGEFAMINELAEATANREPPTFWLGLRNALRSLSGDEYDLVIIDTAPTLNLSTIATILATDGLLVPCPMRSLDVESLKSFTVTTLRWIESLSERYPIPLRWFKVLPTMRQSSYTEELNELAVRERIGGFVLPDKMPRLEALQRSSGGASTVFEQQLDDDITSAPASARKAKSILRSIHNDVFAAIRAATSVQPQLVQGE
jgi:chromosome partitioning protein